MNTDSSISTGVSIAEFPYRECVFGVSHLGNKVTPEKREASCKEFKRITGVRVEPYDATPSVAIIAGVATSALIVGIIIGYALSKYGLVRFGRKSKKNNRKK